MGNTNSTKVEFTSLSSRFDSIRSSNFGRSNVTKLSDDCSLIWLDANINVDLRDKFLHVKSRLRRTFSSLTTFDDIDQCIEFITTKNRSTDSLFIITNCLFSKRMVEEIYNFQQVKRMYLFCQNINEDYNVKWFEKNAKIHSAYDDIDIMIVDLIDDLKQLPITDSSIGLPISLFNANLIEMSTRNLNSDSTTFIWSYLFINILVQAPVTSFAKELLLNECKSQLHDNNEELIKLQEFQRTYTSETAIRWYSRDSFLFKLVNQALRTEHISNILKFRLFIHDLHNQLKHIQSQQSSTISIKKVYRGCRMSAEEFSKLQKFVGNMIAFNTFVSTTIDRQIAVIYAGNGEDRPRLESVLFEIQIDNNIDQSTSYFANIKQFSHIPDEEEILFSIGTICHVITIDKIPDTHIWLVSLKLSGIINDPLKSLIEQIRNELCGPNELVTLGNYLCQMGLYNDAEQHYLSLRNHSWETKRHTEQAAILTGLIRCFIAQDKLSSAIEYCNEAQELLFRHKIEVHIGRKLWIEMGNFCRETKKFFPAFQCYIQSCGWRLCKKEEDGCMKCDLILAEKYTNEGIMDLDYDNPDVIVRPEAALNKFQRSFSIHQKILPENHLLFAIDYYHMGLAKQRIGPFNEALNHFQKALEIRRSSLPINHLQFAEIYLRLGNLYFEKNDYINALLNYEHALDIQLMYLPRTHSGFALTYNGLGEYYQRQNDYHEAAKYFNKAYNHYPETAEEDRYLSLRNFNRCQEAANVKKTVIEGMHNHQNSNNIDATEKLTVDFRRIPEFFLIEQLSEENIDLRIRDEGTQLRCQKTLTRSQIRILWNFLRKDCDIQTLRMVQGKICEDENDVVLIGEALQTNTSLIYFELSTRDSFFKKNHQDISLPNIRSISSAISINKTLKSLTISTLTVEGIRILADGLYNNSTLTKLDLSYNNFSSNNAFKYLIQSLHANQSIEKLSLSSTQFGYQGSVIIAEMLKINRTITYLTLHNNQIGTNGASIIGEALKINQTLTYLGLSDNKINANGMKTFDLHQLKILDLSSNNLGPKGIQYLAVGLKENTSLTNLYLGWNKILTQGFETIDSILMTNKKLNILDLSQNEIGSSKYSSTYMYDGLTINCSITDLNLQNNLFTGTTLRPIINALKSNRSLTTFSLDSNQLRDDGAEVIGNLLMENNVLRTLILMSNNIGDQGVRYICDALKRNHSLIKLSLSINLIGDVGASMLADALTHNTVLEELDLIYNKMTKQGIAMLETVEELDREKMILLRLNKMR